MSGLRAHAAPPCRGAQLKLQWRRPPLRLRLQACRLRRSRVEAPRGMHAWAAATRHAMLQRGSACRSTKYELWSGQQAWHLMTPRGLGSTATQATILSSPCTARRYGCRMPHHSSRRTAVDAGGAEARVVAHGLGHAQQLVGELARGAEHQRARPPRPRRRPSGLPILQQLHLRVPVAAHCCAVIPK